MELNPFEEAMLDVALAEILGLTRLAVRQHQDLNREILNVIADDGPAEVLADLRARRENVEVQLIRLGECCDMVDEIYNEVDNGSET